MTLAQAERHPGDMDRDRVLALTDEDIARQIAEDPDVAPDVTALDEAAPDVRSVRERVGLSQDAFARAVGIPVGTLRNWEQRRWPMEPAAVALFRIIGADPEAAFRLLGRPLPAGGKIRRRPVAVAP